VARRRTDAEIRARIQQIEARRGRKTQAAIVELYVLAWVLGEVD
jgi:hypothetical protein